MTHEIKYWLMKTEPSVFSIDDLKRDGFSEWEGVRNFQARNYMRDEMQVGDLALFYHSNATPPGVAGVCRVCQAAHPDFTAWNKNSPYYDKKASPENPIWMMVEVEFVEKFSYFVSLSELRKHSQLKGLKILEKGSRLSITPVEKKHFELIRTLGHQLTPEPKRKSTAHKSQKSQKD